MTALIALPGFPIRKSPGQRLFDNSPELIAAYHVLLRLSAPRHPPCALYSLATIPRLQRITTPKLAELAMLSILANLALAFRHLMSTKHKLSRVHIQSPFLYLSLLFNSQ